MVGGVRAADLPDVPQFFGPNRDGIISGAGPRATPTVDRGLVFAYGATGILNCLDAGSGRRVWTRDVLAETNPANLEWGVSASPLVYDDAVVVTGGNAPGPSALAYRRTTGETLWRGGSERATYASPVLATLAGRRVLLIVGAAALLAVAPEDGKVVLRQAWTTERTPKAAQPIAAAGDRVFLSASANGRTVATARGRRCSSMSTCSCRRRAGRFGRMRTARRNTAPAVSAPRPSRCRRRRPRGASAGRCGWRGRAGRRRRRRASPWGPAVRGGR